MAIVKESRVRPLMVVIPLILSLAGFILAMIALFAGSGSQQQALEEYHLIALNMSDFGHDLIPTTTSSSSQPTATSFWDEIEGGLSDLGDDITDELNDIANDVADKLAQELGISQWYSVHVMTACEGDFAPNATNPRAWYNTTNCTSQSPGVNFNLTEVLQRELDEGPLQINASEIPIPDSITEAINYLNSFLLALFVLYVLSCGLAGLSFLSCIAVLALSLVRRRSTLNRVTILVNVVLAALATLALALVSAIATAISKKGAAEINDAGDEVGISAVEGTKFLILTWVAFAVMFVTLLFWSVSCCLPRRDVWSAPAYGEKARASSDSNRGLLGLFRRRR
ncbi:hypothetical protein M426DRAFT_321412 [Hypoxylon sp. CI-4A]|nr:hypothetical protein M426DRAFT_321412 [Hypoxylon sp. CI-4A]